MQQGRQLLRCCISRARHCTTLAEWLAQGPFTLVMSSGFFSFFAHTGMLGAIAARGFTPSAVSGSSAGALVGGAWAAGVEPEQLGTVLAGLSRDDFWDPRPGFGLLAGARFDRLLRELLPALTFERCRAPVAISVFDIFRRRTRVLSAGDLPIAIRASCAVPGLFHPVWIERRPYWDGGILDRPGLHGVTGHTRILFHHIASRSPWRRALAVPARPGMITLVIDDLPRSGPNRLDAGRDAMATARRATERALDAPIDGGIVRVS